MLYIIWPPLIEHYVLGVHVAMYIIDWLPVVWYSLPLFWPLRRVPWGICHTNTHPRY